MSKVTDYFLRDDKYDAENVYKWGREYIQSPKDNQTALEAISNELPVHRNSYAQSGLAFAVPAAFWLAMFANISGLEMAAFDAAFIGSVCRAVYRLDSKTSRPFTIGKAVLALGIAAIAAVQPSNSTEEDLMSTSEILGGAIVQGVVMSYAAFNAVAGVRDFGIAIATGVKQAQEFFKPKPPKIAL